MFDHTIDFRRAAQLAESILRDVGAEIRDSVLSNKLPDIHYKGELEIYTEMDLRIERTISERLRDSFPEVPIVGEESSSELARSTGKSLQELCSTGPVWTIDPIDGTNNFSNHIPLTCTAIGLLLDGKPQLGVVYDPMREELFSAVRGHGATLNGRRISVSQCNSLERGIVGISFPPDRKAHWKSYSPVIEAVAMHSRTVRSFGSGILNQCWTACGRLDGLVEHAWKIWDATPGVIITEEAGCVIANADTGFPTERDLPLDLFKRSFVFAGPAMFDELYNTVAAGRRGA